jgi:eukaryotic-like serine/threonine-protein kinase
MAVSDTLIGTLFDGRYRILRRIGSGGMADVYLAEDQELGRNVAIKILNDRHAGDEQFVERFRREAKNAAGLSHANIVSIYDRGEAEGTYYIAMEHIDGRSLKELIVARGPAPVGVAIEYARNILAALRFAHKRGIVHRDIKPHNVLDDGDGRVKVTDFGIARAGASQMTEAGSIVGTAQYLSPEQARGASVDARSDLYSLGIVLYELLTGKVPFTGDSPVEIAMKHLSGRPQPPSAHRAEVPRDLDLVVLRALAKDPDERYQSAEEMDADLARIEQGLAVSSRTAEAETRIMTAATAIVPPATTAPRQRVAYPPPPPPPVYYDVDEPPPRRRSLWPWLIALLLLAGAIVAGAYVYDQIQDELDQSKPVAVPLVEGMRRTLAEAKVREVGLTPRTRYEFNDEVPVGDVISQSPDAGDRIDRGNGVNLLVSLGREAVEVPDVRGQSSTDAVAALAEAGLKANVHQVPSDKEEGTVVAQDPPPGRKIPTGESVRINVSSGPKPVQVPSVLGQSYEDAAATLQAQGFAVRRRDVDSNQPGGTVIAQDPAPGASVPRNSAVTLDVSNGPTTTEVPSVEGFDREAAVQALEDEGFEVRIEEEPVDDESFVNLVLSQDPPPGAEAERGSTVTIVVGVPQSSE